MKQLGTGWAGGSRNAPKHMKNTSKVNAFRRIDIAGVASSILATPTIEKARCLFGQRAFSCREIVRAAAPVGSVRQEQAQHRALRDEGDQGIGGEFELGHRTSLDGRLILSPG